MTGIARTEHTHIQYQPALDGLRGAAVLLVMLYHHHGFLSGAPFRGGYVGVDIFFVLSGFLITSLLLTEHRDSGSIRLGRFWARRARRLVPALLAMLVLVALLARFAFSVTVRSQVRADVPYVLTYLENWHIVFWNGAWRSPLSHTWSLAIEEQWYLAWPVALLALFWIGVRQRALLAIALGLAATSAVWTAILAGQGSARVFFGTDVRAQQLLIGAALAIWHTGRARTDEGEPARGRWAIEAAGVAAVGVVLLTGLFVSGTAGWGRGGYLVIAVLVALIIDRAVASRSPVRSMLASRPLIAIGWISYGLYLFHFPIYRWLNADYVGVGGWPLLGVRLAVTGAVATASYVLLENPIRRGRFSWKVLVPVGTATVAGILVATTVGITAAAPAPRSTALAYLLPQAAATAPPGATRVLLLGGDRAVRASVAAAGPVDIGTIRGLAIGTGGCGLTEGSPKCRALPDDLRALSAAFQADAVVLMPDEADLTTRSGPSPVTRPPAAVVAGLERLSRMIPGRRLFVMTLPCTPADPVESTARDALNVALVAWADAHHVGVVGPRTASCSDGGAVPPPQPLWDAINEAIAAND